MKWVVGAILGLLVAGSLPTVLMRPPGKINCETRELINPECIKHNPMRVLT